MNNRAILEGATSLTPPSIAFSMNSGLIIHYLDDFFGGDKSRSLCGHVEKNGRANDGSDILRLRRMRDYLAMSPLPDSRLTRYLQNASAALNSATLSLTLIALALGAQRICQGKEFLPKSSRNLGDGLQTHTKRALDHNP
ncbi:hypothetical protein DPMN_074308 [Dreissena polymorpha]|uniref:Uncharacterized protein n=1 Tax=Dreissena polymorpha TaxID=45954 RepID=A0A9D3YER2_DREPO|nr:hypothetical protein DPMN_074308 [Dreissena polymorpha]